MNSSLSGDPELNLNLRSDEPVLVTVKVTALALPIKQSPIKSKSSRP